jgi:trimeric autotransporter adhesin
MTISSLTKPVAADDATAIVGTISTDDLLFGTSGDDVITGGVSAIGYTADGIDVMQGGAGDDRYIVNDSSGLITDTIIEYANEGIDTVFTSVNYTLPSEVENIVATVGSVTLTGNTLANTLNGSGTGSTLKGMEGNDTYIVGTGDIVQEGRQVGTTAVYTDTGGIDTIQSAATVTLAADSATVKGSAFIENITLTGSTAASATGNAKDNHLTGNSAANTITGGAGNDTLDGGGNTVSAAAAAALVTLKGVITGLPSTLIAGNPATITAATTTAVAALAITATTKIAIDAAATVGATSASVTATVPATVPATVSDNLNGGLGNDTFIQRVSTDTFTEGLNAGTDTIVSMLTTGLVTASANIENITLTGTAGTTSVTAGVTSTSFNATGNALANIIKGNSGDNTLHGGSGTIADTLYGLQGNDFLNGGAGADVMVGGWGNDTYTVDNVGDVVSEIGGDGTTDHVNSFVSYSLNTTAAAGVEELTLNAGAATALNATGNFLNNLLTGNSNANVLDGKTGTDNMTGGSGNDTYIVDNTGDIVTEGAVADTDNVISTAANYALADNVEKITLSGTANINATVDSTNTANITMIGNSGINSITGGTGNDTITGGAGEDVLNGGAGNDIITGGAGKDDITLGVVGQDTIVFAGGVADTVASADSVAGIDVYHGLTLTGATGDLINLTAVVANVNTAVTTTSTLSVNEASFIDDMNALLNVGGGKGFNTAVAGDISAAVVTVGTGQGDQAGKTFLTVDLDHDGTFTAADFVIQLVGGSTASLDVTSFI